MTDIVERLRIGGLRNELEAADEIDRLRAALRRVRDKRLEMDMGDLSAEEAVWEADSIARATLGNTEEKAMIDKSKTYRTRDGREVRIYATDGDDETPVHGAIHTKHGWKISSWTKEGLWCSGSSDPSDLIEVRPRVQRKVWVNVYELDQPITWLFRNRAMAESAAASCKDHRIACVEIDIDVEEGHGL